MNPAKMQLPTECGICRDKIGLYQPYYTVHIHPHFVKTEKDFTKPTVLCPNCFHAYEDFLIEREVITNHAKNMQDIKNV